MSLNRAVSPEQSLTVMLKIIRKTKLTADEHDEVLEHYKNALEGMKKPTT